MGIFDKLKGSKKDKGKAFEDELMDIQSGLIALTLNTTGKTADKIFAYCSILKRYARNTTILLQQRLK